MALLGQVLRGMKDKEVKKVLLSKPASDLTFTIAAREIIATESDTQHVSIVGSSTVATGSMTVGESVFPSRSPCKLRRLLDMAIRTRHGLRLEVGLGLHHQLITSLSCSNHRSRGRHVEQNYSHVDKEALAVVFGVRKFYPYLAGRSFAIITDSKPVVGIFNPTKSISENLSPRMLRWRHYLNNFDYTIQHKKGQLHTNADFFSRMPMETIGTEPLFPEPAGVLLLEEAPKSSVLNSESIAAESKRDPIISKVIDGLIHGRDYSSQDPNLNNYTGPTGLFTVLHGCLLKGNRVVVPFRFRPEVLARLHRVHQGIVRTKSLARSYQLRRRWHEGHKTFENPNVDLNSHSNDLDNSVSRYNHNEMASESESLRKAPELPKTDNRDLAIETSCRDELRPQNLPEPEETVEPVPGPELKPLPLETMVRTPSKGLQSRVPSTRNRKPPAYLQDYALK
ncbi:hypothetical protein B566_EDAN015269 [Ephemera danica]|nr:hypothetical protein B566_EDAN015269 [Ephemera danica]